MPNPIILIFEYHQVPAGEHLFQYNLNGLVQEGYKTYLDEETFGVSLKGKLKAINAQLPLVQTTPEGSEGFWQQEIVTTRKKSVELLVQNKFNYHAYDVSEQEITNLAMKKYELLSSYPTGAFQGLNDFISGKIPHHREAYDRRVQFQNQEFTKQAMNAKTGVLCIAGIYHASHLQSYLRSKFPEQDILTYFPYQGPNFEPFEINARDPESNKNIFPHNVRLIDMDHDLEKSKTIIMEDLAVYKHMFSKLKEIEGFITQAHLPKEKLTEIHADLIALKSNFHELKALNNNAMYLFAIDVYLLKCAVQNKDFDYIKTNYSSIKKNGDALVKTAFKDNLIRLVKEIVTQYRAEQPVEKSKNIENTYNSNFFAENSEHKTTAVVTTASKPACSA